MLVTRMAHREIRPRASLAIALGAAALSASCVADPQLLQPGGQDGGGGTMGAAGATGAAGAREAGAAGGPGDMDQFGSDPFVPVAIPTTIAAPLGTTLALRAHGRGSQIYTCGAATAGAGDGGTDAATASYAWTLKAPDAKLYDHNGAQIGVHFGGPAGPTWMSTADESATVGAEVTEVPAPAAGAIPWLLLEVVSRIGTGVFSDVTYVQRVNTTGGAQPTAGCDAKAAGTDMAVAYTADYFFYGGGSPARDGGATSIWPFPIPMLPQGLGSRPGTKYKFELHGWGDELYTCAARGTADGGAADAGADAGAMAYAWVPDGPSAPLYDENDVKKGKLSAGPTWTSDDGSFIVATNVIESAMPSPTAIPWLLIDVTSHGGPAGVFSDVTEVQQSLPSRGVAPDVGCDAAHVGTHISVPFSADYYFHTGTPG
jgi:Protein of unknown function (DUF3455)